MMDRRGSSLLEVMVGLLLLSLIAAPLIGMFAQSTRIRSSICRQLDITYLARNRMEIIMSKSYHEAMDYRGTTEEGGYLINTNITPYSVETGGEAIYIIGGGPTGYESKIMIYTPEGPQIISLDDQETPRWMSINLHGNHYNIKLDGYELYGERKDKGDAYIEISLIHMPPSQDLAFYINGDAKVRVYAGLFENWNISGDSEYKVIENCAYREYSIFKVRIEVLEPTGELLYWVENIISLKH